MNEQFERIRDQLQVIAMGGNIDSAIEKITILLEKIERGKNENCITNPGDTDRIVWQRR